MRLKGIFKEKSSSAKLGILFLLMVTSGILHIIIATALVYLFADNGLALIQQKDLSNQAYVNYLKLMQLFSGVGLFITPTLFYAYLTNFDFKFAKFSRQSTILVIAIMLLITPFIGLLLEWNMMISFPEWVLQFDINSEAIVTAFLQMDTIWDLFYMILVIAVIPAIGEELLFRGYLQKKLGNWLRNPHIAILITAFLFSAIHFHFQGMIPRFVLGVLLGYLFYWSNSLWLPILAHFVNNAQAVIFSYHFKVDGGDYSVLSETKVDPMIALFSLASVALLLYIFHQNIAIKKG
jgi:membrane protease YdiL (CAAX protease family)